MTPASAVLQVTREQAVRFRLAANNLTGRLPRAAITEAARFGLQDSAPRDGLLAMHARLADCDPDDWADPRLIQTYSPRAAVYILPAADFGIFTLGRMPLDPAEGKQIEADADRVCAELDGAEVRGSHLQQRRACASGRIALPWTTSALYTREVPRPDIDPDHARRELCRRHLRGFGPSTPTAYAWWSGLSGPDAGRVWAMLDGELLEVDVDGAPGWVLAEDEERLRGAPAACGVRLLPGPDLRLFGLDRGARFAGPGQRRVSACYDTFHPNGVLVDGEVVGMWGRKKGQVDVRLDRPLPATARQAIEAEASAMPIPGAAVTVSIG